MTMLLPDSLDSALALYATAPESMPVAGGTDLLVRWPEKSALHDRTLLDLSGVAELKPFALLPNALRLGAMTTYWDFLMDAALCAEFPLMATAARQVGAVQIQARGTWAGNVVNGSPAADGVLALMAYDAVVEVRSVAGLREIPLREFHTGYRTTKLQPGELVTAIIVPRKARGRQYLEKVGSRRAQTISKVGLAICHSDDGWRVVVNAMAPTVKCCPAIEHALTLGAAPTTVADWLPVIRQDLTAIDDVRSTRDYREQVLARLLQAFSDPWPLRRA